MAKKAALESIVLLKNNKQILPLKKNIKSIAIIGPEANDPRLGGYSGPGNHPVSILNGIKAKVGDSVNITFTKGCNRIQEDFIAIPEEQFFYIEDKLIKTGLKAAYYNNILLEGEPALTRIDPNIDFRWTLFSPDQQKINYDFYSVRWTGKLRSPITKKLNIGIKGDDGYRLFINNELIIDNWKKQTVQQITKPYFFEKDKVYDIKVEFYETTGNVWFKMIWDANKVEDHETEIANAVIQAKNADIALVCVGIEEGEFRDRAFLSLPGRQEELINAIAKTETPVVVILVGGSAITMEQWRNNVDAIVDVWYPGDEGGNAIADIIFGDYNPAGRLPITFPLHESQLPLYYNHKPTGRGDDYINLSGKPLFSFGYGLSYTTFKYSDIQLKKSTITTTESTILSCKITNTGSYDGDEVVQLYIKDVYASVARPVTELKGFKRIHIKKGETKEVHFEITPELLKMLDKDLNYIVEPGDFRLTIGAASNDIRLRTFLTIRE